MAKTKFEVALSDKERKDLQKLVRNGKASAKTIRRANILLASDTNAKNRLTVAQIAAAYSASENTVVKVRRDFVEKGAAGAVTRKKRETPPVEPKIDDVASLYQAFPPEDAFRIAQKLEIHYTPKHGSWLDIAEIELSALGRQCLGRRRIDNIDNLNKELKSWWTDRNARQKGVEWHMTTDDARSRLKHLYPILTF